MVLGQGQKEENLKEVDGCFLLVFDSGTRANKFSRIPYLSRWMDGWVCALFYIRKYYASSAYHECSRLSSARSVRVFVCLVVRKIRPHSNISQHAHNSSVLLLLLLRVFPRLKCSMTEGIGLLTTQPHTIKSYTNRTCNFPWAYMSFSDP